MAIETEIKYRLTEEQFDKVQNRLKELNANFCGEEHEENNIYVSESLVALNAVLRIRKIGEKTILTFKKRLSGNSDIKEQIEHETIIENAEEMEKIIENLGFEKRLVYEKHRKTWHFREVEVLLDKLPFGLFMEIEGSFLAIKEAEMFIETEEFIAESKTYPHLTSELGTKKEDHIEARF